MLRVRQQQRHLRLLGLTGMPGWQDAAAVAGRGLAVFPLPAGGKAARPGWQRRCTADPGVLARTWPDGANIGVGCRASGIVGLDLDRHDGGPDGVAVFAALCSIYGQRWPDTLTIATPHGGLHLYFRILPGLAVASTIGRWPGIDIRAPGYRSGGYLAGPGSVVDGSGIPHRPRRPRRPPPPLAGQPAHHVGAGSVTPAPTSRPPPRRSRN